MKMLTRSIYFAIMDMIQLDAVTELHQWYVDEKGKELIPEEC